MADCIFCGITAGEIPAAVVARTDHALAFEDLNPQAPVHVLVIPTRHVGSAADVDEAGAEVWPAVLGLAVEVARAQGIAESGFRLVINAGAHGGQSVDHLHLHLLGGRPMQWPPG